MVVRFKETGSNKDKQRPGRSASTATPDLRKKLRKRIQRNPEVNARDGVGMWSQRVDSVESSASGSTPYAAS